MQKRRQIYGQMAKGIEDIGRIRRRQIGNPSPKRGVAHIQRNHQNFVHGQKHGQLQQHGQAAGGWVDLVFLIQFHDLLAELQAFLGGGAAVAGL